MDGIVFMSVMASLVGGAVWVLSRRPRVSDRPAAPLPEGAAASMSGTPAAKAVCPGCQREYPARMRYCSHDARALVAAHDLDAQSGTGVVCRRCERSFDGATRFCPFDGGELSPPTAAARTGRARRTTGGAGSGGKICPNCADRYPAEDAFCGRDGEPLVALN